MNELIRLIPVTLEIVLYQMHSFSQAKTNDTFQCLPHVSQKNVWLTTVSNVPLRCKILVYLFLKLKQNNE